MITNIKVNYIFRMIFYLMISSCIVTGALPYLAGTRAYAQYEDFPNEFIFEVLMLPEWRISEAIFAYEVDGKYYLPIGELSEGFEFFTDVEIEKRLAQGFASKEENSFVLDGARNELIIRGERRSISEDSILISDFLATDDLYVELELLNEMWPVTMRIELSSLAIKVDAEEELSFMRNKARREQQEILLSRNERFDAERKILPQRENPYELFGNPVIDYQGIFEFDTNDSSFNATNIISGTQNIGKLHADFSGNFRMEDGELQSPDNIRLKFSRKSAGDDYLVEGIRRFEAGDVRLRQRDLISNSSTGRGLVVSNDNRDRSNEFDRITIEGTGPPGWEIELYNNDRLIDFGTVADNGEYTFEDVILNFGNNEIKTLFFGPQGQVREENKSYTAGGNMLSPGVFNYEVGAIDLNEDLISFDSDSQADADGLATTLSASYGLNRNITIFGNYSHLPDQQEDRSYITAGINLSTLAGLFEIETYHELDGGNAFSVDYITRILDFRTNLRIALFNNFESVLSGFGDNSKTFEAEGEINKNTTILSVPIGLRLDSIYTDRETGSSTHDINFTQTYTRSGIRVSHNTRTRLVDHSHDNTTGGFTTTVREGPWQLRGGLNYEVSPDTSFQSINSEIRYKTDYDLQAALNFTHNFDTSDYQIGTQLGYDFGKFLGTAETNYDSADDGLEFILRLTSSLHPYTADSSYDLSSNSMRNSSPIRANIFLDEDADGVFDEDELPLEGVKLRIGGGRSKEATDENGVIITSAPEDQLTNISIDTKSLGDPYYMPGDEGFSVIPIRGKMIDAAFPVVETGSIEGYIFSSVTNREVPGLTINLINSSGEISQTTETGYDGYYVFEFVIPDSYTLQTDESHQVQLQENAAEVTTDELYVYGNDLYINDDAFVTAAAGDTPIGPDPLPATPEKAKPEVSQPPQQEEKPSNAIAAPVTISEFSFQIHNGMARLLFNNTEEVQYEVIENGAPDKIDILIRNALFQEKGMLRTEHNGKIYNCEISHTDKGSLISISGNDVITLKGVVSLPSTTNKHRFLADIF